MRLYALDMGSLCGWCYFGNPDPDDGMTHALDSWLWEWRGKMNPSHAVACFDGANNFRKKLDPEYKLGRAPKPDNFIAQLRLAPSIVESLGIAGMRVDTMEADDCIASVVTQHAGPDCEVIIISEDKDLMCLVGDTVRQYSPKAGMFYDAAAVEAKHGVQPWRIGDYLAMAGDAADNIPGIAGIGKKYAAEAIRQTRSMRELFRRAGEGSLANLKPATQAKIFSGRAQYEASLKLVELRCDLPCADSLDDYRIRAIPLENGPVGTKATSQEVPAVPDSVRA